MSKVDPAQAQQSVLDSQQDRRIALLEKKVALLLKMQQVDVAAIEREFQQEERERTRQAWREAPKALLLALLLFIGLFAVVGVIIAIFLFLT